MKSNKDRFHVGSPRTYWNDEMNFIWLTQYSWDKALMMLTTRT